MVGTDNSYNATRSSVDKSNKLGTDISKLDQSQGAKIDTHAHFLPDFYVDALQQAGHLPGPDGTSELPKWNVGSHLEFMNSNNIIKSYLSISSPGVFLHTPLPPLAEQHWYCHTPSTTHHQRRSSAYPPHRDEATAAAIDLARRVNDYAAGLKVQYPGRIGYFASLPLPDIAATLAEIERCFASSPAEIAADTDEPIKAGDKGARPDGVVMMSNYHGTYLGDPALQPVYEALERHNAQVILAHPTTPCTQGWYFPHSHGVSDQSRSHQQVTQSHDSSESTTENTNDGAIEAVQTYQRLNRPLTEPPLLPRSTAAPASSSSALSRPLGTPSTDRRVTAASMLDFPFDTARAVADLLVTGTPSKYSSLRWIIPHAGGALPGTLHRIITHNHPMMNMNKGGTTGGVSLTQQSVRDILQAQFYFDLAGLMPIGFALAGLLKPASDAPPATMRGWVTHEKLLFGSDVPFTPHFIGNIACKNLDKFLVGALRDVGYGPAVADAPADNGPATPSEQESEPGNEDSWYEKVADDVRIGNALTLFYVGEEEQRLPDGVTGLGIAHL